MATAIVVKEQRVLLFRIVINNTLIIKYFIAGRIHWWVDDNNQKIELPEEEFKAMKSAVKDYLSAKRIAV